MRKAVYILALILPLLFLGAQSAYNIWARMVAPVYTVSIEGYDPRDLVYGEYLQFRLKWDDSKKDFPQTARIYLPEGNAYDLQTMLWEKKNAFTADISLMGRKAVVRDVKIDGKSWPEGLAAWRQTHQNNGQ